MESEKNLLITPIKNMSHNWDYEITEWKKTKRSKPPTNHQKVRGVPRHGTVSNNNLGTCDQMIKRRDEALAASARARKKSPAGLDVFSNQVTCLL